MGVYPGDGPSERFLEIGHAALDAVEKHLQRLGYPVPAQEHHFVMLDNGFQALIRAASQNEATAADVINALAHVVAMQMFTNGSGPELMHDFDGRVSSFLLELLADEQRRAT